MRLPLIVLSLILIATVLTVVAVKPHTPMTTDVDIAAKSKQSAPLELSSPTVVNAINVATAQTNQAAHSHTPVKNTAADFSQLSAEQQVEIQQLNGRSGDEGKSYQVIEVKPGVVAVLANNGPQIVPVAVMNDDGTVSIHEY